MHTSFEASTAEEPGQPHVESAGAEATAPEIDPEALEELFKRFVSGEFDMSRVARQLGVSIMALSHWIGDPGNLRLFDGALRLQEFGAQGLLNRMMPTVIARLVNIARSDDKPDIARKACVDVLKAAPGAVRAMSVARILALAAKYRSADRPGPTINIDEAQLRSIFDELINPSHADCEPQPAEPEGAEAEVEHEPEPGPEPEPADSTPSPPGSGPATPRSPPPSPSSSPSPTPTPTPTSSFSPAARLSEASATRGEGRDSAKRASDRPSGKDRTEPTSSSDSAHASSSKPCIITLRREPIAPPQDLGAARGHARARRGDDSS